MTETLRKHPVGPTGKRVCRNAIKLPEPHNLTMLPGDLIITPIYAIHHDPEYYPQPEVFRPERFEAGEKEKRHPMTYMPFGAGPRVCIGERFAMMVSMLGVALLIRQFRFSLCSNTSNTMEFDPKSVRILKLKEDLYLKVDKI